MDVKSWNDVCLVMGMYNKLAERFIWFNEDEAQTMHHILATAMQAPKEDLKHIKLTYIEGHKNKKNKLKGADALAPLARFVSQGKFRVLKTYILHVEEGDEGD